MKITTATGKEFSYSFHGLAFTGDLWFGLENVDFISVAQIFSNPNETRKLTFYTDENEVNKVYEGYTSLKSLNYDYSNNNINIGLGR